LKETVSGLMLALLLIVMLTLAFNIQPAKASGTIYIRADGSIEPPTAPIQRDGDLYTFTDNIYDEIVVKRSNIIIDGNGYTVHGRGIVDSQGIDLSAVSNVTIKDTNIEGFFSGILIRWSSNNTVSGNNITNNRYGIFLSVGSNNNNISRNNVANNYVNDGIYLYQSSNNILYANNITNSNNGIFLGSSSNNILSGNNVTDHRNCGICFQWSSNNNTVYANNITNSFRGMMIYESSNNNTVYGNTMISNSKLGVELYQSSNSTLSGNVMEGSEYNFAVYGYMLSHFMHSIDVSNLVNGKPIYYLVDRRDLVISPATHPQVGYLALVNCSNLTVQGLTMKSNGQGILLVNTNNSRITGNSLVDNEYGISIHYSFNNILSRNNITNNYDSGIRLGDSSNNTISGNNIANNHVNFGIGLGDSSENTIYGNNLANNRDGLYFYYSSDNTIFGNNIADNKDYGIFLADSPNNKFYHNNFKNNTYQVYASFNSTNIWDDGYPSGGNYWSDYNGADLFSGSYQNVAGSDGIGDTPYVIDENNRDNYPLMEPWLPKPPAISATVDIKPDTLNLKSKGKWITCYIELPEGYNVSDIDVSTVMLDGTILVDPAVPIQIGDCDNDSIPDLMLHLTGQRLWTI